MLGTVILGEQLGFGEQILENPLPQTDTATVGGNARRHRMLSWDEVESGLPEGATKPLRAELWVTEDGTDCFKAWQPSTVRAPEVRRDGGRVIPDAGHAGEATAIACPDGASDVLKSWRLATSSQQKRAPAALSGEGG